MQKDGLLLYCDTEPIILDRLLRLLPTYTNIIMTDDVLNSLYCQMLARVDTLVANPPCCEINEIRIAAFGIKGGVQS